MTKMSVFTFAALALVAIVQEEVHARNMIKQEVFTQTNCGGTPSPNPQLIEPGCVGGALGNVLFTCGEMKVFATAGCTGNVIGSFSTSGCINDPSGGSSSFKLSCEDADWYKVVQPNSGSSCNADNTIPGKLFSISP